MNDILAYNVERRHDFLLKSIGYLEDENLAVNTIRRLLCISFAVLGIGSLLQVFFFHMYNKVFHPFKDILDISTADVKNTCNQWQKMLFVTGITIICTISLVFLIIHHYPGSKEISELFL